MKSLLLIAAGFLLRAVCVGEPEAAGGFYLGERPISVWQACRIMFYTKGFQGLSNLSVVAPLSRKDAELLVQAVAVEADWIMNPQGGIWDEWMEVLELYERHHSLEKYKDLHRYLLGAAGIHLYRQAPIELRALTKGASRPEQGSQPGIVPHRGSFLNAFTFDLFFKLVIFWAIVIR